MTITGYQAVVLDKSFIRAKYGFVARKISLVCNEKVISNVRLKIVQNNWSQMRGYLRSWVSHVTGFTVYAQTWSR